MTLWFIVGMSCIACGGILMSVPLYVAVSIRDDPRDITGSVQVAQDICNRLDRLCPIMLLGMVIVGIWVVIRTAQEIMLF